MAGAYSREAIAILGIWGRRFLCWKATTALEHGRVRVDCLSFLSFCFVSSYPPRRQTGIYTRIRLSLFELKSLVIQ